MVSDIHLIRFQLPCFWYLPAGLEHGLDSIGGSVGNALPRAMDMYNTYPGGAIILLFTLVLGMGATIAEPGLTTFIYQIKRFTNGRFKMNVLERWVPLGVATGVTLGVFAIVSGFGMPMIVHLLLVLYVITCALDYYAEPFLVAAAWDSAGVTTGEVTVPLVLSLGSGLARAGGCGGGYGLLGLASVCPIMAALLAGKC